MPIPWVIGEYNEVEKTRALFAQHGKELAAVIVEPMQGGGGCIPGTKEFLQMLRDECTKHGIVLIFDEVMTSRLSSGGLQKRLGITPDITSFGKYLGGGASFGAFGGKRELMERFDPNHPQSLSHAGTFNNNVMSMAGGLAGLTQVFTPAEADRINALGDKLRDKINALAKKAGSPLQATGVGSLINLHFSRKPIRTPADTHPSDPAADKVLDDLHKLLHLELIERGYYMARRGFIALSLPTTEKDADGFVAALADILETHGALIERSLPASL
jgi:glutamate-1-semialdehyde 2,1-aminomutase